MSRVRRHAVPAAEAVRNGSPYSIIEREQQEMSSESTTIDPYETVLADLRSKRDQIDQAIAAIEAIRSGVPGRAASPTGAGNSAGPNISIDSPGAFLGISN